MQLYWHVLLALCLLVVEAVDLKPVSLEGTANVHQDGSASTLQARGAPHDKRHGIDGAEDDVHQPEPMTGAGKATLNFTTGDSVEAEQKWRTWGNGNGNGWQRGGGYGYGNGNGNGNVNGCNGGAYRRDRHWRGQNGWRGHGNGNGYGGNDYGGNGYGGNGYGGNGYGGNGYGNGCGLYVGLANKAVPRYGAIASLILALALAVRL